MPTPQPRSAVLITRAGQVLLIERQKPGQPVYHVLPGGGIEAGETPEAAARRELREELGVEIEVLGQIKDTAQTDRPTWIVRANLAKGVEPAWLEGHGSGSNGTYRAVWIPISDANQLMIFPRGTKALLRANN